MTRMPNGTKVFIGGSRSLSRLNKDVKRRIDNIIDKGFMVLVGDANGMDKAIQQYVHSRHFHKVVVFCMEGGARNNIGSWPTRTITAADPGRRDFAFYSTKDRAMVEEADYGFMLWDGRSRGTLTNVVHLVRRGKPILLYIAPDKSFCTLLESSDLAAVLDRFDPAALHRIDRELEPVVTGSRSSRKVDSASLF